MRNREYSDRKKVRPGQIRNKSRYVTGRIHSHRRPVEWPLDRERPDSPETRGLTVDDA